MSERVVDLGSQLELWRVEVNEAREQDVNARAMPPAMFDRLQATIARDGRLESLPLLASTEAGVEVISGHHRLRAARAAGHESIFALVDVSGLTHDQIAAKQLAHNAIAGTDDETLLAQIFASITDVDARMESFIDPAELDLPEVDTTRLPRFDLDFEFRSVLITFMPHQQERFTRAMEALIAQTELNQGDLYVVDRDLLAWWQAVVSRTRHEYDCRALTTAVSKMVDVVLERYELDATAPEDVDPEGWVALSDILGSALVPPDAAAVLTAAVEQARSNGTVTKKAPWTLITGWAEDYLSSTALAPTP